MVIRYKCHVFDFFFFCSSFFCENRKFSTAMGRSDQKPCTTLIKDFALWFSTYCYEGSCIRHLSNFYSFKYYMVYVHIKVEYLSFLADMFRFWPKELSNTLFLSLICTISSINIFIECYCTSVYMTVTPKVVYDCSHIVSSEVILSYALKHFSRVFALLQS